MERRSAAKRRHVYADLNSSDATSTLTSRTVSTFIPNPPQNERTAHRSNDLPIPPVVNLNIPPAYQQPFNRTPAGNLGSASADRSSESHGKVLDATMRNGRKWYRQLALGVGDALRIQPSLNLVSSDAELRAKVIKSSLINLICLLSIFVFDNLLYPAIKPANLSQSASDKAEHVKTFFDLFWIFPIFLFCFWINASWSSLISKRALVVQYPTSRQAQTDLGAGKINIFHQLLASLPRFLLIVDYQITVYCLSFIPVLGKVLAFGYACLLNSYYCFDFSTRGWNLRTTAKHMRQKIPYFIGFGLTPSLLCGFGPLLLNMAVFALIYPFLVIQALQARAVPALSLEDATTSLPLSPYTNGRPPSPFYSHQGSPIGTPITTSNGLPPLSPNGLNSSESVFAFPNEASDQIAARLHAYQQDSLLVGDDDYDGGRQFNGYRHTGAKDTIHQKDALKIAYRYLARAWVLVRHVPLFWIATSSQETMRWFILGIERRVGRSSGSSMFIQSDRRGSGAGMSNGGAYMGKKRNSSYK